MPDIPLIVNADDYGYTPGVSAGILESFREGLVSSTSVMTTHADRGELEELDTAAEAGLGIGVHINLTKGEPAGAAMRSALPDGLPSDPGELAGLERAVLEDEIGVQTGRLLDSGIEPGHIDTHHHVQQDPRIFELLLDRAEQLGVAVRSGSEAERSGARERGVPTAAVCLDGFFAEGATRENLLRLLRGALEQDAGAVELICHPGRVDEELSAISSYTGEREREIDILTDPETVSRVRELGYRPVRWDELSGPA